MVRSRVTRSLTSDPAPAQPLFVVPFVIATAFLMEGLDSTIVIAALPAMARDFGVDPVRLTLVVTAYVLSLAAFIPASGWLADRFGARQLFTSAISLFVAASLASAMAQNLPTLVAARVLQGVSGAMMTPIGRLLIIRSFDKRHLASAIAYLSMPVLIGPIAGPLLGGLIVTHASWRYIFLINFPIGLAGIWLTLRFVPATLPEARRPFDVPGFLLCAGALVALQAGLEDCVHPLLPHGAGLAAFPLAAALAAAYWLHARRAMRRSWRPALEIDLLSHRLFGAAFAFGGLSRIGLNAVPFLLQLELQLSFGRTPFQAGATVFLIAFGALALKPMTTRTLSRFGFRTVLCGNGLLGAAMIAGFALFGPDTPMAVLALYTATFGVTRSLQFNAVNALLYADIPSDRHSAGASLGSVGQQMAMGLGISLASVGLALLAGSGVAAATTYRAAFVGMAVLTLVSASGFLLLHPGDGAQVSGHQA